MSSAVAARLASWSFASSADAHAALIALTDVAGGVQRLRQYILGLALHGRLLPASANRWADDGLPDGWVSAPVGDLGDCVLGKMLDRAKHRTGTSRPYLRNINVRWGTFDLSDLLEMFFEEDELERYGTKPGDVLICEGGEPGRSAVWTSRTPALIQKALHRVRPGPRLAPDWLVLNLRYDSWTQRLNEYFTGATIKHFTGQALRAYMIRLPPLAEQRRIVAKVDQLMALCDELETRQTKKREIGGRLTRAALLALTSAQTPEEYRIAWQRVSDNFEILVDEVELVSRLRETVLELVIRGQLQTSARGSVSGRAVAAEARDLAKQRTGDVTSFKGVAEPFRLPDGWAWARIGEVFEVVGGLQKTPGRSPRKNHYPYLRVENVQRGRLELGRIERFELEDGELERLRLERGDLLVVEGNGSEREIGRCAQWGGEIEDCVHQNHLIRCRALGAVSPEFTLLFLNSPSGKAEMKARAVTTSGLYSLSVGKIRGLPVPVPPPSVAQELVRRAADIMRMCESLEVALKARDMSAERTTLALVAAATEGSLSRG